MARIKVRELRAGMHPSEVVVAVETAGGVEEKLIVDRRSIVAGTLNVGYPVGQQDANYLVELPRETTRGSWRVWVSGEVLAPDVENATA